MGNVNKGAAVLLVFAAGLVGCKEDRSEVSISNCSSPESSHDSDCIRSEENIVRSKPKPWTLN